MTIPGPTVNTKTSSSTRSDSVPPAVGGDLHAPRHATHPFVGDFSNPLAVFEPSVPPLADPADLASPAKTRAALLELGESPRDTFALAALWDENRLSIEHEMRRHLHRDSNSPLLQQLLARLVWHARFFCDEVDHPQAWVARCANLEARRLALQLIKLARFESPSSAKI
jgi:hypothetical protein